LTPIQVYFDVILMKSYIGKLNVVYFFITFYILNVNENVTKCFY